MKDYEVKVKADNGESVYLTVKASDERKAQEVAIVYAEINYDNLFGYRERCVYAVHCEELEGGADYFQLSVDVEEEH